MKHLILLLALLPAVSLADTDTDLTNYCYLRALVFYDVAVDRDNGFSLQQSAADVRAATASADNPDLAKFITTQGQAALANVYSQPTVQPQVWFGYELALCEAAPPASSMIIMAAPK